MIKNKLTYLIPLLVIIFGLYAFDYYPQKRDWKHKRHSTSGQDGGTLPTGFNELFAGSGECLLCHNSQVNQQGESISIIADWRSTMKANAARDPLWQAKVSHEGLVNPGHKEVLEDVCTRCHAPAGNHNAHHNGQALYSMAEMQDDPLAMDGVQCTVCHQITESSLGNFSGQVDIGTEKKIWGPYVNPFANPMINNTGYTPTYGNHINDAKLCGSCHTLLTNTVDLNGNLTGTEFVEQAIYQEWENSVHPSVGATCQSCHVPRIDDLVKISTMPPWLDPRSPFGMHQFAGANVFMSRLLKDFGGQLGVTASATQFDSTIARSTRMLQQRTLDIALYEEARTEDTLFVSLFLQNKAGHKFPAGYPSRRAFIELVASTDEGETIFHSGKTDEDFNLLDEDPDFENHFAMINSEDQVQIYEMVMGDVNGDVTTVLERASEHLKDNRIPPMGFTTSHFAYDTVQIVGDALTDSDFNNEFGTEGSGSDRLAFHIPLNGYGGNINITAKVYYQTINDKWLEHMFSYNSEEIDLFRSIYDEANKTPVLVGSKDIISLATFDDEKFMEELTVFPNPATNSLKLNFNKQEVQHLSIFKLNGELLAEMPLDKNEEGLLVDVSPWPGILVLKIDIGNSRRVTKKVLVK
jgi:hypothetical protein